MSHLKKVVLIMLIAFKFNCFAEGEPTKFVGISEQLPKIGKYQFIKNDSYKISSDIFKIFEDAKSKKIIFICLNFYEYNVNSKWDLEIKSKKDAEKIAMDYCGYQGLGFELLGYKVKKEIRF